MRDKIKCPITIGEYERYNNNKQIFNELNKERQEWLEYFMFSYNYTFSDFVMKKCDNELWVIINTGKDKKEFKI